ncbi:MAG: hypothetical protein U5K54_00970 [Cytophagales bacterium]|nr:hypothetical protein [Cytophagales bacterium]
MEDLVSVFHQVVRRMDMNFNMDFPYVLSFMQAPVDGRIILFPNARMATAPLPSTGFNKIPGWS